MNVAIIMDGLGLGGAERQAAAAAIELTRQGVDVELIHYHPVNEHAEALAQNSVRTKAILDRGPLRLGRIKALTRHIRQGRFDIVYSFQGTSTVWGTLAARRAGARCIFAGYRGQTGESFLSRTALRMITRGVTGWIVNAECVRDFVVRTYRADRRKVHIVPNGIARSAYESPLSRDEARRQFDIAPEAPAVVIVANLRPVKNHAMFLRAARRVVQARPDTLFLAAGEGPLRTELEAQARQYGLADNVRFLGRVRNVPDLLAACDLSVLTSFTEGLPNTIAEAQGAGLPCISSANGGAKEVIVEGQTGFIVPVDDDAAMADRLMNLIGDPAVRADMGLRARQRIRQEFSTAILGQRLLRVFERGLREGDSLVASSEGEH